jgi:hypothetical protein
MRFVFPWVSGGFGDGDVVGGLDEFHGCKNRLRKSKMIPVGESGCRVGEQGAH